MHTYDDIMSTPTQYKSLIGRINSLPLWVKQALYYEIRLNILNQSDIDYLDNISTEPLQLYCPVITEKGALLIRTRKRNEISENVDINHKSFLNATKQKLNMLEISHSNNWSLKQTCEILFLMISSGYVEPIRNQNVYMFALYITDKINLDEFLIRSDRLSPRQINKAMQIKQCSSHMKMDNDSIINILTSMGYLDEKAINSIEKIKESANEMASVIDQVECQSEELVYFQEELNNLIEQKKKLIEKINFYQTELQEKIDENLELTKKLDAYANGVMGKVLLTLS
ncbi:MAG: hypothetical protein AB1782_13270 [Cyanobacteriota bacterium]